ncbi:MAG: hypothetical protein U0X20_15750 [Caldilineaceae bacterium]
MPTQEDLVREAIKTASVLTLNENLSRAVLSDISANGAAAAAGLSFASGTISSLNAAHWFKVVHTVPVGTETEFRTYLRQPSAAPDKELRVRMYALNDHDQFIMIPGSGGSIGSSVAHGAVVGTPGLSTTLFPVSGQAVTYFFRIKLFGDGVPPSGPYVFLACTL